MSTDGDYERARKCISEKDGKGMYTIDLKQGRLWRLSKMKFCCSLHFC